ncbi:MAG: flagellar basal body P-ring formation chaperone FlgA [Alphaproteobacteria bacterium]
MRGLAVLAIALAAPAATAADVILAARTIPANSVIASQDIIVKPGDIAGVAALPADVIGKETRVAVYAGRPLRLADIGPPAVIERNQIVPLIYEQAGLRIVAEGRSLSRAGAGERVRVMNLSSRSTVTGRTGPDGRVFVSP